MASRLTGVRLDGQRQRDSASSRKEPADESTAQHLLPRPLFHTTPLLGDRLSHCAAARSADRASACKRSAGIDSWHVFALTTRLPKSQPCCPRIYKTILRSSTILNDFLVPTNVFWNCSGKLASRSTSSRGLRTQLSCNPS